MKDSSLHGGRPADSDPPGELAGRLLRRAHGGGVIDAGWAQRRFAYTTGWIADRFAVLGLLNARYGTVDNRAPGASLPVMHGTFTRTRFGNSPNESTPGMSAVAEASPRKTGDEGSLPTANAESFLRPASGDESSRTTGNEGSLRTVDDRKPTPGREPLATEITATSANIGDTRITPSVQHNSGTLSRDDAAVPRVAAMRTQSQKSQPSPPQKPHEPLGATAANDSVHQPSASNVASDSANTKQSTEVLEIVTRPRATGEPTLRVDARAEAPLAVAATAAESTVTRESSELNTSRSGVAEQNPLPASPEQQLSQRSQTANSLPLQTATMISRVALEASGPLAMRDETVDRGGRESESPVAGAADPPGWQSGTNFVLSVAGEQTAGRHQSHLDAPLQQTLREPALTATEHRSQPTIQADGERAHPRLSAPEILQRSSSLSGARMIWRKDFGVVSRSADHAPQMGVPRSYSAQSVSSWETLQRAEATAADSRATSGNGGTFAPAASTQPEAGGIDLEQITEHVSRVILRRVSVERERRGIGRWL